MVLTGQNKWMSFCGLHYDLLQSLMPVDSFTDKYISIISDNSTRVHTIFLSIKNDLKRRI